MDPDDGAAILARSRYLGRRGETHVERFPG